MVSLLACCVVAPIGCGVSLGGLGDESALGDGAAEDASTDFGMQDARDAADSAPTTIADTQPDLGIDDVSTDASIDARDAAPDVPPPPVCDASDPDLVACYRFEPGPTQPHDESMYRNDGTSTATTLTAGVDGDALSLDGATSYDHVPDSPSLDMPSTQLTMETWFMMRSEPTTTRSGLLDEDGQYGMFVLASDVLRCSMAPGVVDTPAMITLGAWTHAACTYDGAVIKVFVNGVIAAEAAGTGTISPAGVNGLAIGMNSPSGDVLDGAMDDLRIYRVARTDAQIAIDAKKPGIP